VCERAENSCQTGRYRRRVSRSSAAETPITEFRLHALADLALLFPSEREFPWRSDDCRVERRQSHCNAFGADADGGYATAMRVNHLYSVRTTYLGRCGRGQRKRSVERREVLGPYLWQTSFWGMQELPHGFPLTQCGFLASAVPPLRQELINCFRALPAMPVACALQSFIRCC